MKYNETNQPLVCIQTNSTCFKGTKPMEVKGVLWHSTGAPNPNLSRYVQPSENDPQYYELLAKLGKNQYGNDWNHIERQAGLNCWIGKFADGTIGTVQTMPWKYRPWGCGSGQNGSCNDGWIQFEICEPTDLKDPNYFSQVYREGCEITAYLCKMFNIDPEGTATCGKVKVPTILCHHDSYLYGVGSGHVDINHWFPYFGKDMSTVRKDVATLLKNNREEDEEDMTQEKFNEMMNEYIRSVSEKGPSEWSQEARAWAEKKGLIQGDFYGNKQYKKDSTREELVQLLYRFYNIIKEEK